MYVGLLAQATRWNSDVLRTLEAEAQSRVSSLEAKLSAAHCEAQEATAGRVMVEDQATKLPEELRLFSEERDAAKEDAAIRARELGEVRASLSDAEGWEKVVHEAYGPGRCRHQSTSLCWTSGRLV